MEETIQEMPVQYAMNNLFFSGLGVDFGHSFSVNAGLPPQGEKWSRFADLYTLASRRERAVQQRGQHHHHQHRPEVRAGTERGRCHCHAMFTAVNIGDL